MKISRAWIAGGLMCCAANWAVAQTPSVVAPVELVQQLAADDYHKREAALAQIAQAGAEAIPPLLVAARAKDPELAWRAGETLRVLSETIDDQRAAAVRKALLHASQGDNAAEAALAKRLLAQWPVFRHHYAAAQLEMLGAEIADGPLATPAAEVLPGPGGFIPAGGVFFAAGPPPLKEVAEIMADFGFDGAEVLDGALDVDKDVPITDEESAELEKEVLLAGDLLKEIGRIAARLAEDAAGPEAIEAEAVADEVFVEGEAAVEFGFVAPHPMHETSSDGAPPAPLPAGAVRIGKAWRGGDSGLAHLAQLQGIHTVILLEAPLTNASLKYLTAMTSLRRLQVERTALSSAALMQFHKLRPEVVIATQGGASLGIVGIADPRGLRIQQVIAESGARRAGLWENDIVTKVAGLSVKEPHDVVLALYDRHPEQRVQVEFTRDSRARTVNVVLGERDEATTSVVQPHHRAYPAVPAALFIDR